jgi:hypothetical protein
MTTATLTISIIAILIAIVVAWNELGGKEDMASLRKRWHNRGRHSPPKH